jgi:WhiB family redox-sensing transcriptional regulator
MRGYRKPVTCVCGCGKTGQHGGRGLIVSCHTRHSAAGTLEQFPPVRDNPEWLQANRPARPAAPAEPEGDWKDRAACHGIEDPDIFWPPGNTPLVLARYLPKAKRVCNGCPVRAECLAYALATDQLDGIWAGTTPDERHAMRFAPSFERTSA